MRVAYLCYWDARRPGGVTEKIASQAAMWRSDGHEATVFLLTPAAADGSPPAIGDRVFSFGSAIERVAQTRRLYAAVAACGPDLAYLRYDLFAPPAGLVRRVPTVVEINSDARAELGARGRGPSLYGRAQDRAVLGRAAGAVCVTRELAGELRRRVPRLEPRVIANGISLDAIPPV